MPAPKNKSIKTALNEELYNEIIKYCERNDVTISQLIRDAIKEYLKEKN